MKLTEPFHLFPRVRFNPRVRIVDKGRGLVAIFRRIAKRGRGTIMRPAVVFLFGWLSVSFCFAQEAELPRPTRLPVSQPGSAPVPLAPPPADPNLRMLPINLAAALQLTNSRPIDVALAAESIRHAAAVLEAARVLWLPSITFGGDYYRHDGANQSYGDGTFANNSLNGWVFGMGSGILSGAVISVDDAIFAPLAARQVAAARQADLRTVTNNTMIAVTDAYFTVEQMRGELAGAIDVTRRASELVDRVRKLAPGLVPELEVTRAEGEQARLQESVALAEERWQVAGAELARILRLDATAQVVPLEPPHLQITLIDLNQPVDGLVEIGLLNRPELASYQAQVKATLARLKQEKFRPLIPSVLIRGWSTPVAGTFLYDYNVGGPNGSTANGGARADFDIQFLWQLNNLGFGNRALVHQRQSELRTITLELFKMQDRVAAEVAQAFSQAHNARRRTEFAEREVKLSLASYEKNLIGLEQTHRVGNVVQMIVRPQETVAAIQALAQSYLNYYRAVADSNRAQFRLYRAMGQPARELGSLPGTPPGQPPVPAIRPAGQP